MVKVGIPTVLAEKDITKVMVSIENEYDGSRSTLQFSFDSAYAPYITADRADAFLVVMIHWLASNGYSVQFDLPVSQRLYYQITKYLLPAWKSSIKILCETTDHCYESGGYVGAGMSRGIDSLSTFHLHNKTETPEGYKINILTLFDAGAFSYADGSRIAEFHAKNPLTPPEGRYTVLPRGAQRAA